MNKALLLVPVAALAVAVFVFTLATRRERTGDPRSPSSAGTSEAPSLSSGETARILEENRKLKADVAALRKKLAEATPPTPAAAGESAPAEADKTAKKPGDWKTRRDAELEAKLKAMPWRKNVKGVIEYWKEVELARAEGRAVQYSPELMGPLNALQADIKELVKTLGLEGMNDFQVFQNEAVNAAWMDAFFQEVGGGTLTEDQLARLRQTNLYRPDPDWVFNDGGNTFEMWKYQIEQNWAYESETAGILTPEQHAMVAKAVTPTYLMSLWAYSERPVPGTAVEGSQAVTDYWLKSFKLPDEQRPAVEAAAAEFLRRQAEIEIAVSARYGGVTSRDAEFDLLIKTIEAQAAAEKKLAATLQVDPEIAKRLLRGSGAVLKVTH